MFIAGDRLALGITTVLTIVFLMESINNHLPKVSYIKAIDCYLNGCFGLVFLTVLETIAAYNIQKNRFEENTDSEAMQQKRESVFDAILRKKRKSKSVVIQNDAINAKNEAEFHEREKMANSLSKIKATNDDKNSRKKLFIDSCCKIFFPCFFVIGNLIYFALNMMSRRK